MNSDYCHVSAQIAEYCDEPEELTEAEQYEADANADYLTENQFNVDN